MLDIVFICLDFDGMEKMEGSNAGIKSKLLQGWTIIEVEKSVKCFSQE